MAGRLRRWADEITRDVTAIYLARHDPRVPWHAKVLAVCVAAYAVSPIDLIPDFIPILGYADELIILPLAIVMVVRMIPAEVMAEYRAQAAAALARQTSSGAAVVIVVIWLVVAAAILCWFKASG